MKSNFEKFIKVISIAGAIGLIITLIILRKNNPDFPIGWIIFACIIAVIIIILVFFGSKIFRIFKSSNSKDSKLPQPINVDECIGKSINILKSPIYLQYIDKINSCGSEELGEKGLKSYVFSIDFIGYFPNKSKSYDRYVIIINQHYPDKYKVLINPSDLLVYHTKNKIASFPEQSPDTEVITEENPLYGTKRTIERTTHKKKEEKKKKEEEEI